MFWKLELEDENIVYLPSVSSIEIEVLSGYIKLNTGYQTYYPLKIEIVEREQFLAECSKFLDNKSRRSHSKKDNIDIEF